MPENMLLTQDSQKDYKMPGSRLEIDPKQLPFVMQENMSPTILGKDKLHKSMVASGTRGGIIAATRNLNSIPQTPSASGSQTGAREGLPELIHKRRYRNRMNFNSMFDEKLLIQDKNNAFLTNKVSKSNVLNPKYASKRNPHALKHH